MTNPDKTFANYPVAAVFRSIQGEGYWAGIPMVFVRLAGCNVGTPVTSEEAIMIADAADSIACGGSLRKFSACTTVDGLKFLCDTDYSARIACSARELVRKIDISRLQLTRVCITGGEPFLYDLQPLLDAIAPLRTTQAELVGMHRQRSVKCIHIETSGTREIPAWIAGYPTWITCSPKKGFIAENSRYIDEWKFLVGRSTNIDAIKSFCDKFALGFHSTRPLVYLQPVNGIDQPASDVARRVAYHLMEKAPEDWCLSLQIHKYIDMP